LNSKINIALIDNEDEFRGGITELLNENLNFKVIYSISNGEDLMDKLEKGSQFPNVFILDLKMKPLDGIETTKIIKEKYPESKIMILSSFYSPSFINYMVRLGVNAFLPKNINPKELVFAIDMVYEKGLYFTKEYAEAFRVQNLQMPRISKFKNSEGITKREHEILKLICHGYSNKQIAEKISKSIGTIENYRQHLLNKAEAKNTAGLVVFALMYELIDIDKQLLEYTMPPSW
jgi:DNA-binding NarL/FixJ family response regulator